MKNKSLIATCVILALIFVGGIVFYFSYGQNSNIAIVKSNDKVVREIDLSAVTVPFSFTVECNGSNTITVEKDKIIVSDADCPDKICMQQSDSGLFPIVCLPHKLVIDKK